MIYTATTWAIRMGLLAAAAQKAAPSAETWSHAAACEIARSEVPADVLELAERTGRLASSTLGLDPPPRIRWLPAETRGVRGVVFPEALGQVWVKVQAAAEVVDTVLHELRHVYQLQGDRYLSMGLHSYERRQADADQFAATWTPWQTPTATPAPVGAHMQISGFKFVRAPDQEAARREWERKYKPLHDANNDAVRERAQRGRRRY